MNSEIHFSKLNTREKKQNVSKTTKTHCVDIKPSFKYILIYTLIIDKVDKRT